MSLKKKRRKKKIDDKESQLMIDGYPSEQEAVFQGGCAEQVEKRTRLRNVLCRRRKRIARIDW
jgi:hypothetical protein